MASNSVDGGSTVQYALLLSTQKAARELFTRTAREVAGSGTS